MLRLLAGGGKAAPTAGTTPEPWQGLAKSQFAKIPFALHAAIFKSQTRRKRRFHSELPLQQSGVMPAMSSIQEQLLHRNVQRFRGGLVFKAHRLLYHSTLGVRVIKKKKCGKCLPCPERHARRCRANTGQPRS